jgi:hypothetical protein
VSSMIRIGLGARCDLRDRLTSKLESLYDFDIRGGGRAPKLQTIGPNEF